MDEETPEQIEDYYLRSPAKLSLHDIAMALVYRRTVNDEQGMKVQSIRESIILLSRLIGYGIPYSSDFAVQAIERSLSELVKLLTE